MQKTQEQKSGAKSRGGTNVLGKRSARGARKGAMKGGRQTQKKSKPAKRPKRAVGAVGATNAYPLTVMNRVFTTALRVRSLNIKDVTDLLYGRYLPYVFPPCVLRVRQPRVTLNIFSSGRIVLSGASTFEDAMVPIAQTCYRMSKVVKRPVYAEDVKLENVVGSCALGYEIDQDLLYDDYQSHSDFTPDTITCVRMFPPGGKKKPVMLVYATGAMVVTGGTCDEDLHELFNSIDWIKYKKGATYRQVAEDRRKIRKKKQPIDV